jgi:hypothetical protein
VLGDDRLKQAVRALTEELKAGRPSCIDLIRQGVNHAKPQRSAANGPSPPLEKLKSDASIAKFLEWLEKVDRIVRLFAQVQARGVLEMSPKRDAASAEAQTSKDDKEKVMELKGATKPAAPVAAPLAPIESLLTPAIRQFTERFLSTANFRLISSMLQTVAGYPPGLFDLMQLSGASNAFVSKFSEIWKSDLSQVGNLALFCVRRRLLTRSAFRFTN